MATDLSSAVLDLHDPRLAAVLQATEELFGNPARLELEEDPEIANCAYIVVEVAARQGIPPLIERRILWHQRIEGVAPELHQHLRLSIDVLP